MHILLISSAIPLPGEARSPRTYNLARGVAANHSISLLLVDDGREAGTAVERYLFPGSPFASVSRVTVRHLSASPRAKLLNMGAGNPWFATHIKRRGEHKHALREAEQLCKDADVIWVDGLFMLQYLEKCDLPIVVDVRDFMSRLDFALAGDIDSPLRRALARFSAMLVRRYERSHLSKVHAVILNSSVDAETMLDQTGVSATVVVNGCDTTVFSPSENAVSLPGSPSLLFVGNFTYPPNHDAAVHLIDEVLPAMIQVFPETIIYLVGPSPPDGFGSVPASVRVAGFVEDVRHYYEGVDVFVCPLRFGTGVKNKILEAATMGCPIIASGIAMEGLDLEDGVHYLRAETPAELVEATKQVLADGGKRGRWLGGNARNLAVSRYSWTSSANQLESVLVTAGGSRSDGSPESASGR